MGDRIKQEIEKAGNHGDDQSFIVTHYVVFAEVAYSEGRGLRVMYDGDMTPWMLEGILGQGSELAIAQLEGNTSYSDVDESEEEESP